MHAPGQDQQTKPDLKISPRLIRLFAPSPALRMYRRIRRRCQHHYPQDSRV
jgi:hypothetical protein